GEAGRIDPSRSGPEGAKSLIGDLPKFFLSLLERIHVMGVFEETIILKFCNMFLFSLTKWMLRTFQNLI
ncbi:MAG: hypothetical protein ACP5QD_06690, partial [Candidatus Ratteibacteria bacterium]